ncbi:arsenate reductase (glutaredoxin) [Flavobacteriaceae bacterium 3-367]|uniref:arsenate reductase (glutaredoxin) n=1 Tax=Eudoraea algarum TaxID=3417568 RepID=UPI0032826612
MIKIYHNPRCRKSREGLELLENCGQPFETIKYLEDVPTKEELQQVLGYLGLKPENLVRKNEAIWKEHYRGRLMTDDEVVEAMVKYPILIERPVIIKGNKAVIGRPKEKINEILA